MPWVWVLPAVAVVLAFRYVATGAGTWYAFTDWDGISRHATWVGLDNFREILDDPASRGALEHTLKLAFTFVVTANVIGLALALALHRTLKTRGLLRAIFFVPVVMSSLAVSYVWQFIFSYTGPLNSLLDTIGLESLKRRMDGRPDVGAVDDLRRPRLAVRRALDGDVPRRPGGHPGGARRGVRGRRGIDVPAVPEDHAAAPRAGDHGERDAEHDLRPRRVRPGARRHGRRSRRRLGDARDPDLQADVRIRALRLRHGAVARPDGAHHRARRRRSSSSSGRARGGSRCAATPAGRSCARCC